MPEPEGGCLGEAAAGEPKSAYGQAKRAAERVLHAKCDKLWNGCLLFAAGNGLRCRGRGNLERMAAMVRGVFFPPLPETGNRRSLVHVKDFIDAMLLLAREPLARGRTYIIAGPETPSGRQLYDALRLVMGMSTRNIAVPAWLLAAAARLGDEIGNWRGRRFVFDREVLARLLDSACCRGDLIANELGWRARYGLIDGLKEMLGVEQTCI